MAKKIKKSKSLTFLDSNIEQEIKSLSNGFYNELNQLYIEKRLRACVITLPNPSTIEELKSMYANFNIVKFKILFKTKSVQKETLHGLLKRMTGVSRSTSKGFITSGNRAKGVPRQWPD